MLARYRHDYPDRQTMGKLEFSNLEITVLSSDAALVLGRWQLERARAFRLLDEIGFHPASVARRLRASSADGFKTAAPWL